MKHLLITTAFVALTAAPIHAQSDTGTATEAEAEAQQSADTSFSMQDSQYDLSNLMGARVYIANPEAEGAEEGAELTEPHESWEDVGEIGEAFLTQDGNIDALIVDVGGFLGMGERQVEIKSDEVTFMPDSDDEGEFFVVYNGPRADLEEKEEFDQASMEERDVVSARSKMGDAPSEEMESSDMAATETEAEAETEQAAAEAEVETEEAAAEAEAETEQAAAEAEAETEEAAAEAEAETEQAAAEAEAETEEAAAEMEAETEQAAAEVEGETEEAATEMEAETDTATAVEADPAATDTEMAADSEARGEALSDTDRAELTADDLQGLAVYDANNEHVGEISELVLSDDGKITDVVVDVGGFLGIGEKPVALAYDDLKIMRLTEGGLTAETSVTLEDLEAMESWEG